MNSALLLSGGMDSTALAFWKRPALAITIDYGQQAAAGEIRAASAVAASLEIPHHIVECNLSQLGSGDMAGLEALDIAPVREWWPYRNQMLITIAAMKAISLGANRILIGALRTDGIHVDGTEAFVNAISAVLALQEGNLQVEAPAIELSAAELIATSGVPIELLAWAHSCHISDYACGMCRGCRKHYQTMAEIGADPY